MTSPSVSLLPKPDTTWFSQAKYGLFVHFLPSGDGYQSVIDAFDVAAFAEDCDAAGVGYLIWTVGQNSGYFCTPNANYDRYAGRTAGETCSTRDLPLELADALAERGIRFLLYAPSPPAFDARATKGMGAQEAAINFNGENWVMNDTLIGHWSEALQEWADRYGKRVSGWWLDGCYRESGFTDLHAAMYNRAVKHGNPDAIVAFNTGLNFDVVSPSEDYLAGESNEFFNGNCTSRLVDGVQWHELSYLGAGWGSGEPRCDGAKLLEYLNTNVCVHGGVLSIDVPLVGSRIDPRHLQVLSYVKAALRT